MRAAPLKLALPTSLLFSLVSSQACNTVTLQSAIPTDANVSLQSYSYCGGSLNVTAYIANLCFNKIISLYFEDSAGESTPLTTLSLDFSAEIFENNTWEFWTAADSDAYIDGVSKLLNITFDAVDIDQTYSQVLNVAVESSGSPPPTISTPAPYATPTGFSQDITDWLTPSNTSQVGISKVRMFNNFNVAGAASGTVIAAQSFTNPDYAFNWVRDTSLAMDVVRNFYNASTDASMRSTYENLLFQYAIARAAEQIDPDLQTGLGEPKFFLNNSIFTGPWGRPQNDGPATSAVTLMEFANAYLAGGGSMDTVQAQIYDSDANPAAAPVKKDLLFVASNWSSPSFDLWEEESSDHFYTRLVQRRALVLGSTFAKQMGDDATAATLSSAETALTATLSEFWDSARNLILYEFGPVLRGKSSYKDISVVLGVIHGYADDGVFSYTDDEVLASAYEIATSFLSVFPIASTTTDSSGATLGIPVGRYPEDVYDGTGTSLGNPWYLCTAAMAELFYRATTKFVTQDLSISITQNSLLFWQYFAPGFSYQSGQSFASTDPQFTVMIQSLQGWGDAFMRRIKFHTPDDGHLAEEFNRNTGFAQGAADLTWSYASVLTASAARADAMGDSGYLTAVANLP